MLAESFSHMSVFYQVSNAVSDGVLKRKYFILKRIRLRAFIRINTCIPTEGRGFKTFSKKIRNYVGQFLLTYLLKKWNWKHGVEHVDGACGVCIH